MFSLQEAQRILNAEQEERQVALEFIADAWNQAEGEGVASEALAHAALFAALATLVKMYGEDPVAKLIAELPPRIEQGDYSLERMVQ